MEVRAEDMPGKPKQSDSYYKDNLSVIVIGASGDLAKKKTFPALYDLYIHGFLPKTATICGYARSSMTDEELRGKLRPFLKKMEDNAAEIDSFLERVHYRSGDYGSVEAMQAMINDVEKWEKGQGFEKTNRVFYFAIPPSVFLQTAASIKSVGVVDKENGGWTRLIVEKPFGHDLASAKDLSERLAEHFDEDKLYRIDHYLGKSMVQNLLVMRFSNALYEPLWSRDHISSVTITFKEDFGTEGRGGYFDTNGIIRDVIQNHLMQVFTLVAMEPPIKVAGELSSNYIRDAKVQVLKAVSSINLEEVVIGQYSANDGHEGYKDDKTVPNDSKTPTFAMVVLRVNNRRWDGVPFIFKAGKALNERKAEVRIQFKDVPSADFMFDGFASPRNELVMRLQPDESTYVKLNIKAPGLGSKPVQSELDLTFSHRYPETYNPDAYTRLLLDVLKGNQSTFVRSDELLGSWAIFTPLLESIDKGECGEPVPYPYGSRGPKQADELAEKSGFTFSRDYQWHNPLSPKH